MRPLFLLTEAWASVWSNPRRGLLTVLGLLIGVASVVTTLSAGESVRSLIAREMGTLGRETAISITPNWRYLASIGWKKKVEAISRDDLEAVSRLPGVKAVSPLSELRHTTRWEGRTRVARILFVSPAYLEMEKLTVESGRGFMGDDEALLRRVAVVGSSYAEALFPGENPVGKRITVGSFGEVEIIGVLHRVGASLVQRITNYDSSDDGTIYMTNSTAARFGADRWNYTLLVEARTPALVDQVLGDSLGALTSLHGTWEDQGKFVAETGKEAMREIEEMTDIFTTFVLVIGGISLLVAGIGVMNVMLISVKERTREFGTRKALGARPSWIRIQVVLEALILCVLGGLAGVLLASIAVVAAASLAHWPAILSLRAILSALSLSTASAMVFGWLPAWRASRLDPVEALRYE